VRALPEEFEPGELIAPLADGWGFDVEAADYAAVGGGSYHWVVDDLQGTRAFVTVDDLDRKPWLGDTRDAVFDGLRRAFDTAAALRDSGLRFVVAPIRTSTDETLRRISPRYALALFPFVDGQAGRFGEYDDAERAAVLAMLAELHAATPPVASVARRMDLELPGRSYIERALEDVNETWSGGPFSEPARQALAARASGVAELLALSDRLRADVATRSVDWVVTHGEPHAANVMRTGETYALVDWDTVALAPPERDLWMLVADDADDVDRAAVDFFRITWDLADVAAFTSVLRSPHRKSKDTAKAYDGLTICVARASSYLA
jgi:hypothetical protein